METLYQIKVNGIPFCEPVSIVMKNAIVSSLNGTVSNVEITPVVKVSTPALRMIEGGKK